MIATVIPPMLLFLFPISGLFSISFFAINLLENMNIDEPGTVAIALGMIRAVGSTCTMAVVQKFGRRNSMIFSSSMVTLSLMALDLILLGKSQDLLSSGPILNWIMLLLLVMTLFANSLGMSPVPWILCGEWPELKHKASS